MFAREIVKELRRDRGLNPRELGELVGVSERQMWRYESGEHEPRFSVAGRIATALGISLDSLYVHDAEGDIPSNGRGETAGARAC